jgi:polar amino acid transport system substrate-binding protein
MLTKFIGSEPGEFILYNRRSDANMAVLSGKCAGSPCPGFVAEYYAGRNNGLKVLEPVTKVPFRVIMVLRKEDAALRDDLNRAIAALNGSGRFGELERDWITNLPVNGEPANIGQVASAGARTVSVGISGDFPPLDYISADGRPAGFNVAFMSEIGNLLDIRFEFVSIEAPARFTALASRKIDVIFFHFMNEYTTSMNDLDANYWISSDPYYQYQGGYFLVKK